MRTNSFCLVALACCQSALALASPSSSTLHSKRWKDEFVSTQGDQFMLKNKPFQFIGTNAYWLPMLNSTENIDKTLKTMKATNVSVVRVWAFNDVTEIPPNNATYFQLWKKGKPTINKGPNGLQRLDAVIGSAEKLGIKVLLTTTNNWNPQDTNGTHGLPNGNNTADDLFPHGFLSNDYGGMDLYVRQIKGELGKHDDFFDDNEVKTAYKTYLNTLIARYAKNTTVFGWELANDPRCHSSLGSKPSCVTTTVTRWHSEISQHVKKLDSNHIIASGAQGFQCSPELAHCPKLFPLTTPPPPKQSPAAKVKRRAEAFDIGAVRKIRSNTRRSRPIEKRDGPKIRGRWAPTATKRQTSGDVGPAFDGSFGVDSQDILNIPEIGFSTLQLFPDQNVYLPPDPNVNVTQNIIEEGINWIKAASLAAKQVGKPVLLSGFGLVSQNSTASFVPFNSTVVVNQTTPAVTKRDAISGLSQQSQATIYQQWLAAAIQAEISGILQYQWSQPSLNPAGGGGVLLPQPNSQTNTQAPNGGNGGTGTPDDGYGASQGTGPGTLIGLALQQAALAQAALHSK